MTRRTIQPTPVEADANELPEWLLAHIERTALGPEFEPAWHQAWARIKSARAMLERARAGDTTALTMELQPTLKAFDIWGPFVADPTRPGRIKTERGFSLDIDDDWFFDPATEAAVVAEILAEVLNRALGMPLPDLTETGAA